VTAAAHDWPAVHAKLRQDEWFLLGKDLPYSNIVGVLLGRVTVMRDVEVRTSNTKRQGGKRTCDIYLRLRRKEEA